jgi:hypothetical protein
MPTMTIQVAILISSANKHAIFPKKSSATKQFTGTGCLITYTYT